MLLYTFARSSLSPSDPWPTVRLTSALPPGAVRISLPSVSIEMMNLRCSFNMKDRQELSVHQQQQQQDEMMNLRCSFNILWMGWTGRRHLCMATAKGSIKK